MATTAQTSPLDDGRATMKHRALAQRCRDWKPGLLPALYLVGWAIFLLAVFIGIGLLVTKLGAHDAIGRADPATERWFARERAPELNKVTHYTTDLGETITVTAVGALLAIASRLLWRRWRESILVVVALAGEVLIFVSVTSLIDRHRPSVSHLDPAPPTSSFPSGHTAASVVLYLLIALLLVSRLQSGAIRKLLWIVALAIPVAVGLSRLYRGMHYPTDVLSGAALGAVWLLVAVKGVRLGALQRDLQPQPTTNGRKA
ncbi:MAG TPA: phosphatase PAP2 family protein [Actinomycetota bacterium]|nr:phosphatase PAP2 family protein [Actinomycetota bacterium]